MSLKFRTLLLALVVLALAAIPALADYDGLIIGTDLVLYRVDGGVEVLRANAEDGWDLVLGLTADDLASVTAEPDEHLLVATGDNLALYRLTTGEWQFSYGPTVEGSVRVYVFEADWDYAHEYEWNIYD